MSPEFLRGVFAASAVIQTALGAFFAAAFAVRRRDGIYLLFGGVCMSTALVTAMIALIHEENAAFTHTALDVVAAASFLALALHMHFVLEFVRAPRARYVASGVYALALVVELVQLRYPIWRPESAQMTQQSVFGLPVDHLAVQPGPGVWLFVVFASGTFLASLGTLFRAYYRGVRVALPPLSGAVLMTVALANDLTLSIVPGSGVWLVPHAFMVYAVLIAVALLLRYRDTEFALEASVRDLEQRSNQLRQSHAELRSAQAELVQKRQLAAVGELAAAIAHEVRNPLAVIVNALAGLRRPTIGEADRLTLLRITEEETARLNRLVSDLVHFARPMTLRPVNVSLAELGIESRALGDGRHRMNVKTSENPAPERVWVDPDLMRRVVETIVENACQAMRDGGEVRVALGYAPGEPRSVSLTISDTGHGMDPEVLSRATDPFFSTRPSGIGLGLAIAERIVEAHGGTLRIESRREQGTSVHLILPVPQGAGG